MSRTQNEALRLADCLERDIRLEWMEIDHNTAAAAELRRLHEENKQLNVALDEWMEKTHWVQDTAQVLERGMHRADVLSARVEALDAENKALRADAERYRWLREQNWHDSDLCVVRRPRQAIKLGYDCPSVERLDEFCDAAIAAQAAAKTGDAA